MMNESVECEAKKWDCKKKSFYVSFAIFPFPVSVPKNEKNLGPASF